MANIVNPETSSNYSSVVQQAVAPSAAADPTASVLHGSVTPVAHAVAPAPPAANTIQTQISTNVDKMRANTQSYRPAVVLDTSFVCDDATYTATIELIETIQKSASNFNSGDHIRGEKSQKSDSHVATLDAATDSFKSQARLLVEQGKVPDIKTAYIPNKIEELVN